MPIKLLRVFSDDLVTGRLLDMTKLEELYGSNSSYDVYIGKLNESLCV